MNYFFGKRFYQQAASTGGSETLTLLQTISITEAVTQILLEDVFDGTYDDYLVKFTNITNGVTYNGETYTSSGFRMLLLDGDGSALGLTAGTAGYRDATSLVVAATELQVNINADIITCTTTSFDLHVRLNDPFTGANVKLGSMYIPLYEAYGDASKTISYSLVKGILFGSTADDIVVSGISFREVNNNDILTCTVQIYGITNGDQFWYY